MNTNHLFQAFQWVNQTSAIADRMVLESKQIVAQADVLTKLSEEALLATTKDDVKTKAKTNLFRAKMRATKAQLRNITKTLEKQRILETEANNMAMKAAKEYNKWVKKHKQESERSLTENAHPPTAEPLSMEFLLDQPQSHAQRHRRPQS